MSEKKILIVDDDKSMLQYLSIMLSREGYLVETALSGIEALQKMELNPADLVISDIQMPGIDGIQLLKGIKAVDATVPIILITAFADEQTAIDALNYGAYSYLHKHCSNEEIKNVVKNAIKPTSTKIDKSEETQNRKSKHGKKIIGQSVEMNKIFSLVSKVSRTPATVLIHGESGTGKELIAKSIHNQSDRANKLFVAINCGAIPETLLESQLFGHIKGSFTGADKNHDGFCMQAAGGTIFLDEIGETPLAIQVKLLRMLQEREIYPVGSSKSVKVDLRVIAATNRNLVKEVEKGNFREDLFYRLNVIPVNLPALRDRRDDIALLTDHFLKQNMPGYDGRLMSFVKKDALALLEQYKWPGNVRELENVIERACIIKEKDMIRVDDLSDLCTDESFKTEAMKPVVGSHISLEEVEKAHILDVLSSVGGRKKQASEILDINPSTLYRKLQKYGAAEYCEDETLNQLDAEPAMV